MKILSFKTLSLGLGMMALSALPVMASDPGPGNPPVSSITETKVIQINDVSITNMVAVVQNTGANEISGVTCGDATITTGKTVADIKIENTAGGNSATVDTCNTCTPTPEPSPSSEPSPSPTPDPCDPCGCHESCGCNHCGNLTVLPKPHHAPTTVKVMELVQKNEIQFSNGVVTAQNTGMNLVKKVTGGTATISTGKTKATIKIKNQSGFNQAIIY
jgi:hypothetical protein